MTLKLQYAGFNYVSYYKNAYIDANSMSDMLTTNSNATATVNEYGIDVANGIVYVDPQFTPALTTMQTTIQQARGLGLEVMDRPLIDFLDPAKIGGMQVADWRGFYNPADPAKFFASYKSLIVSEAAAAQAGGATLFCVGTEIDQLCGAAYLPYWQDVIASVRSVFSGKLTYSAIWSNDISPWAGTNGLAAGTGNITTQVSFWNLLDYIGIDTYAPLSDAANPTLGQLEAGWKAAPTDPTTAAVTHGQSLVDYYAGIATSLGKPLLFTEMGYGSESQAAKNPFLADTSAAYDPGLQARLYQAFFNAWSSAGSTALKGALMWDWDPNAAEVGPANGINFSPQGLPAQAVIAAGFAAALAPTSVSPPPPPIPAPTPAATFTVADTSLKTVTSITGEAYGGPVSGLAYQYIYIGTDSLNVTPQIANTFVHTGSGMDAIDVRGVGGTNVLDGGTNSNFLVGGTGAGSNDTFFVDDRAPPSDIWSTVANFHANDAATIFGITANGFVTTWADGEGAAGYSGLTLHASASGAPTASITLSGFTMADLSNGRLAQTFGTEGDGTPYLYIHGI